MNDGHVATATVIQFPTPYSAAARRLRLPSRRPAARQPQSVRPRPRRRSATRPSRGCAAAPPLRLTRRGRVVVVMVAVVVMCAVLSLLLATASASAGTGDLPRRTHVVQPGETLWAIALDLDADADTRVLVAKLVRLNGLASVDVVPGQALLLPAEAEL
jgi:LysM repeat protein